MPENSFDQDLQRLLAYPPEATGDKDRFVVGVMERVRRERRRRRFILGAFGAVGGLFGIIGAGLLSGPIGDLFSEALSTTMLMQAALFTCGAAAFYLWFMNDDPALGG